MCLRLSRAGYSIAVHSRTRTWAEGLLTMGVAWDESPALVGRCSDVVISMVGGGVDVFEWVRPLLSLMGETIVHQGGPGAGQHTKLVNQTLIRVG